MKNIKIYNQKEYSQFDPITLSRQERIMKKWMSVGVLSVAFTLGVMQNAWAQIKYTYSQLAVKDLDEMSKIVSQTVAESRQSKLDRSLILREGLFLVLSRPNPDFLIEKIISPLRNELEAFGEWESTLRILVQESVSVLKKPKNVTPQNQVTHLVFLENVIAELRPKAAEEFTQSIYKIIADADIKVTKQARAQRQLSMMKNPISPSQTAQKLLPTKKK